MRRKTQAVVLAIGITFGLMIASAQTPDTGKMSGKKMSSKSMTHKGMSHDDQMAMMDKMSIEDKAAIFDKMSEKDKMAAMKMAGHDMGRMSPKASSNINLDN